eukprot:scaffold43640_cov33-Tisochrysis_lutea.AAC.2
MPSRPTASVLCLNVPLMSYDKDWCLWSMEHRDSHAVTTTMCQYTDPTPRALCAPQAGRKEQ